MKILIVRHADPDYEKDSLTEKGWREAAFLAKELSKVEASAYYCSPLGRAKDTASLTLQMVKKEAEILPWLQEFEAPIEKPNYPGEQTITWDWLPQDWATDERYFGKNAWYTTEIMTAGNVKEKYDRVCQSLDGILAKHGYKRNGNMYEAAEPNNDTIVLFCHFGLECVLLSHLLNISPMALWHGCAAAPSSVTTLATEERRPGIVYMRMLAFGERTHLYMNGEEPSFSARFRECYTNEWERLD